ncbi:MAG: class I SAM-dependent methyltransferase [Planctomycetaceae bacterium]|nr:class I SAM-dependent methyltransferase [Planctomycetaceae bacterium]
MAETLLPSIWLGQFRSAAEWQSRIADFEAMHEVCADIDDRLLWSRRPFAVKGWCAVCKSVQPMSIRWDWGNISGGAVSPAWTEIAECPSCHFNSRMRALFALLSDLQPAPTGSVYLAEQTTLGYETYKALFPKLVGSEYLGPTFSPGHEYPMDSKTVRHEDICRLSFADEAFDLVLTQDVFEHVADYRRAFAECCRVLNSKHGRLLFTIPFFANQECTAVLATIAKDGSIQHIHPPEIHGNPLGGGSLCFQHFGWDLLAELRQVGFSDAVGHLYYGPWQGHFGRPCFVFSARKGASDEGSDTSSAHPASGFLAKLATHVARKAKDA